MTITEKSPQPVLLRAKTGFGMPGFCYKVDNLFIDCRFMEDKS